jgi:hypothetical protein
MSERLTKAWAKYDAARNDSERDAAAEQIEECQNADECDAANESDFRD